MPALPGKLEPDKVSWSSFSCAAEERKKRQKSRLKVVESSTMAIRVALKKIAIKVVKVLIICHIYSSTSSLET